MSDGTGARCHPLPLPSTMSHTHPDAAVVDCHVEVGYTHIGGMPMSVHTFCLSSRRATARVGADGTVELRTDPRWFTPYMRRETVEWTGEAQGARKSV